MSTAEERIQAVTEIVKKYPKIFSDPNRLSTNNTRRKNFLVLPLVGERYSKYVDQTINREFLAQGEIEITKHCQSINGRMSQELYHLFVNDLVNEANILKLFPTYNREHALRRIVTLHRRYYKDDNNLVRDNKKQNKVVFDPIYTYDMIMGCHLLNSHAGIEQVYHALGDFYANAGRRLCEFVIKFCSVCNPDMKPPTMRRIRPTKVFKHLMPMERIHFELIEPFPGEKIEGKYSQILYCQDYYSRFIWMFPLKSTKFKHIVRRITEMLLSLPRLPLFIDSVTLGGQDMFDIFETIAEKYSLQIGLGTTNRVIDIHKRSVAGIIRLLRVHKEELINDWNKVLHRMCHVKNGRVDWFAEGIPSDLLTTKIPDVTTKFKVKRQDYMLKATDACTVKAGLGCVYLEVGDEIGEPERNTGRSGSDNIEEQNEAAMSETYGDGDEYEDEDEEEEEKESEESSIQTKNRESDGGKEVTKGNKRVQQQKKKLEQGEQINEKVVENVIEDRTTSKEKNLDADDDPQDINGDTVLGTIPSQFTFHNNESHTANKVCDHPEELPQGTQESMDVVNKHSTSPVIPDPSTSYVNDMSSRRRGRDQFPNESDNLESPLKKKFHLFVTGNGEQDLSREI